MAKKNQETGLSKDLKVAEWRGPSQTGSQSSCWQQARGSSEDKGMAPW